MSSRKYKQYPAEFRESSAKLALETDQPMSQTARELGVTPKSLYSWVNSYSGNNGKIRTSKEPASEEIKRLKKELSKVTEPPRVYRRPVCLSYAALGILSSAA